MHLNKELKGERDISLIKILAFPVAMQFIVYRYDDSVKIFFLILCSMGFGIDCVFCTSILLQRGYTQKHMLSHESHSYLHPVLQPAKIVYIDDSY